MKHFICFYSKGILIILFLLSNFLYSQETFSQVRIKGKVIDSKGESLYGVNVVIKGTTTGLITDAEGNYSISVPSKNSILQFSYIGYVNQEIKVGDKTVVDVALAENTQGLDEVVVIGYGSIRKRDLTGAVSSIRSEEVLRTNPAGINQALQGKLAGVQVQQADGAPGASISILIRGANSFTTSTEPLYVVDGIPFGAGEAPAASAFGDKQRNNPLSLINPKDIASIEVLKDASATAIYGSRAANGVVLITTKGGRSKAKIDFSL